MVKNETNFKDLVFEYTLTELEKMENSTPIIDLKNNLKFLNTLDEDIIFDIEKIVEEYEKFGESNKEILKDLDEIKPIKDNRWFKDLHFEEYGISLEDELESSIELNKKFMELLRYLMFFNNKVIPIR